MQENSLHGAFDPLDTEVVRSRLQGRLGRQAEAIAGFDAALNTKPLTPLDRAILLAEKALVLGKAGRRNEAMAIADQAEKALEGIETDSAHESVTKYLQNRLRAARGDAGSKDRKAVPRDR